MKNTVRNFCVVASGVGAMAILAAQAPPAPQQPPTPSTEIEIKTTIRGEPGAPPHYAVPDFIALTNDKETVDAAKLIARGAVGRPGVRARVRHDSARHLPHHRADADDRDHRVRSLARARRRRCHQGIGQAHRQHVPGRDAPVQRRGARRGARPRVRQRRAQKSARRPRTRSRTRFIRRRPTCAASRARSSRSSPTATTSASSTRSRRATAKRCTSATTTARIRCA